MMKYSRFLPMDKVDYVADVPRQMGANIALHAAVITGDEREVLDCLEKGAKVNSVNFNCFSTVHVAAALGHARILGHLLEHGGDTERQGLDGLRPIHMLMFTHNAVACLEELLKYKTNLNGTEEEGATLLQCLLNSNECDIAKIINLLKFEFDMNAVNIYGNNCLHTIALNSFKTTEKIDLANAFIKRGTNLNALNKMGETALHIAVRKGSQNLVQVLLENNADIGLPDVNDRTPMDAALKYSKFDILAMLLKYAVIKKHKGSLSDTVMESIQNTTALRGRFEQYDMFMMKLKKKKISKSSYVTFYDILICKREKVAKFLYNEDIVEGFLSSPYSRDSFYAQELKDAYSEAERIKKQKDVLCTAIDIIVGHVLPQECVDRIANFFNNEDATLLQQFVKQK